MAQNDFAPLRLRMTDHVSRKDAKTRSHDEG